MKLITENLIGLQEFRIETDKTSGVKSYYIEGVFMQADQQNRNGRIYEKSVLKPAVDKYIAEQVSSGRAVGELNHPSGPNINLERVSHKIEDLHWEGSDVIGKAKILATPMGNLVASLLDGGVQLGVSSRGIGSVLQKEGIDYVANDFILNTIDIVQDPSAPDAYVNGIMENVDWKKVGDTFIPVQKNKPLIESKYSQKLNALVDLLSRAVKY